MKCDKINLVLIMALALAGCGSSDANKGKHTGQEKQTIEKPNKKEPVVVNEPVEEPVVVAEPVTADINLSWIAPSERETAEGEEPIVLSLSEIAGYKIYYGTAPGDYNTSLFVDDSIAVGYTFNSFTEGTYYFVITTIDTNGDESRYSTVVTIVI